MVLGRRNAGWALAGMMVILTLPRAACAQREPSGAQALLAVEQALVEAIAAGEKSVVAIARVHKETAGEQAVFGRPVDPFGHPTLPAQPAQPGDPDFLPTEYGTGVVIDAKGLILTVYQLLSDDSDYFVSTPQRKVCRAWVKAADPRSGLAVLAVDAGDLRPAVLADAAGLKKGQLVVALGNPRAIAQSGQASAAWGIVANLAQRLPAATDDADAAAPSPLYRFGTLIQTDAKLNLGSSGGPLVNLKGEMVGLCVAPPAVAGFDAAATYAIPVDKTFRRALDALRQGREVEYGFLGIEPANLEARDLLAGMQGIRVANVFSGAPAQRQGLKAGDIVTSIDGEPIRDCDALMLHLGALPVDAVAQVAVLRGGKPRTLEVTLAKYPVRGKKIVTELPPAWRGLRVDYATVDLSDGARPRTGLSFPGEGALVTEVAEGSAAASAKLRKGMLITHVDGAAVRCPKDFFEAVAGKTGEVALKFGPPDNKTIRMGGP